MKPERPVARRSDYRVVDIEHAVGVELIRQHHYARGDANTHVFMHGLVRVDEDVVVGVAHWLPPTRNVALSVSSDWRRVLCLSRLVILPDEPQNAATILLGASIRRIRQSGRWAALVSYADLGQGHEGTIYRASNWTEGPLTQSRERWIDPRTGRQVATKATRNRTFAELEALGYVRGGKSRKRKFTYALT